MSQSGLYDECGCKSEFSSSEILKINHNRVECPFKLQEYSFLARKRSQLDLFCLT